MHFSFRSIAIPLLVVALGTFAYSMVQSSCVCTNEGHCFCLRSGEDLTNVSEAELVSLPEPAQTQYRNFLTAWKTEYELRTQEWAELYAKFHGEAHTTDENVEFNRQLASAHRDFVLLFRQRDELYRAQLGI